MSMVTASSPLDELDQLRSRVSELEKQLADLRSSYQNAPVGLCVLSPDLRFLHINQALAEINGVPVEEHLGRRVADVLPDLAEVVEVMLQRVLTERRAVVTDIQGTTPGSTGQRVWSETWSPAFNASGELISVQVAVQDVTEARLAQARLRESEERLRRISDNLAFHLDNTPLAVIEFSADFRVKFWGRRAEEMFGWPAAEVVGKRIADLRWVAEEDQERVSALSARMAAGEDLRNVHRNRNYRRDGTLIACEWYNSARLDEHGRLDSVLSLVLNVNDVSVLESRIAALTSTLRARAELFEKVLESNPGGLAYSEDPECRTIYVNRAMAELLGISEGVNASLSGVSGRDMPFRVFQNGKELTTRELPFETACRTAEVVRDQRLDILHQDGTRKTVLAYAAPLFDEHQRVRGCVGAFADITASEDSRKRLELVQERLNLAQEVGRVGVFDWNLESGQVVWSPQLERIFGLEPGTFPGTYQAWLEYADPDDIPALEAHLERQFAARSPEVAFEFRIIRRDGTRRWIYGKASIQYGGDGKPKRLVGVNVDFSEYRIAQERLELAQEAGQIGVWDYDASTQRIVWTPQLERLFGLEPGSFDGKVESSERRMHPEDLTRLHAARDAAIAARQPNFDYEFRVILPSGETRWQTGRAAIFYGESGRVRRIVGANVDITERRRAEEELRRSNTDLTQFAYAVSHDLQQPLRMMAVFSQLLVKKYRASMDANGQEIIDIIVAGAQRMDRLLKDLLIYSRLDSPYDRPDLVDCNDVLAEVEKNLAAAIEDAGARVEHSPLPKVYAHRVHLVQLFQNLLSNAVKYRRPEVECRVSVRARPHGAVWLFEVEDNGIGIEQEQWEYVFGIFKRLHSDHYEGTGIGLALCKRIVENYGGDIWLRSEPGQGSVFSFTIPVTEIGNANS